MATNTKQTAALITATPATGMTVRAARSAKKWLAAKTTRFPAVRATRDRRTPRGCNVLPRENMLRSVSSPVYI